MSKIEVRGHIELAGQDPVSMTIALSDLCKSIGTNKDELLSFPYLSEILHKTFTNAFLASLLEKHPEMRTRPDFVRFNRERILSETLFRYDLLIDGQIIDPNQVLSGQAHFIEGNKLNKNGNPKSFIAHTVVMSTEQWEDFMAACEQIEQEYPEEKDGYTKDGKTNQVIRHGRLLSRICQERLGWQRFDYASLPLEEIRAQIGMLEEIESKKAKEDLGF